MNHRWGEPVRFLHKTERSCLREGCGIVKVTRHEACPGPRAGGDEHWTEFWRDGERIEPPARGEDGRSPDRGATRGEDGLRPDREARKTRTPPCEGIAASGGLDRDDEAPAEAAERRLEPIEPGLVIGVQHAPDLGLVGVEPAGQLDLRHARVAPGHVEGELRRRKLAPWVIAHFPPHRVYVEPFGGAASVLLRKERSYAEVYNDLDDEVVSLFRVLRKPDQAARLIDLLRLTPFARAEFRAAYEPTDDPIEQARRLIVRSFMGFGSNAHASQEKGHRSTGFRATSNRSGTTPARDWANYPAALAAVIERFHGVVIESRPAIETMRQHDRPDTLHYVDPPYLHDTRAQGNKYDLGWRMYRHELTAEDHAALLDFLGDLGGMVVLSGYPSALYDDALPGWRRLEKETHADGARPRTEVLWINPAAAEALDREAGSGPLFSGGAA